MNPDSRTCPLCSASPAETFLGRAFDAPEQDTTVSICACPACDFAWQWPLERTAQESAAVFHSEYQAARKESYFDKERRGEVAALQLDFLDELGPPERTLLDIGCGDGTLATAAAQRRWAAVGLDPAMPEDAAPVATNLARPPRLIRGTLEQLGAGEQFMCVTLWDVVEHLPDPEPTLAQAWERVAPGGWLVLETGNYQSTERMLSGQHWWAWQLDHRWYFAPSTLARLLEPLRFRQSCLARRVLRPWSTGNAYNQPPSALQTALSIAKRPWRAQPIAAEHATRRQAAARWPEWSGLSIFTLALQK
ncbi:hypothetical protein B2J86_09905 [Acidovorax sp. SRB_14]|uniref:class I SAM-dependent methyltransferase n=1 Tax=Acidovorax sp. SRB_14 TaxID=1962699 RepID=UPI001565C497|nr:class I SAM-dependent methyltransferase [Acidovorax sp. SRB_14]NMM81232.1 hypothetical protein [Acidovorax sp. SRB_14]